jgi:hypothetical protein
VRVFLSCVAHEVMEVVEGDHARSFRPNHRIELHVEAPGEDVAKAGVSENTTEVQ